MKTICSRGYHNGSMANHNHALGHMMYGCNIVHHVPKCMSCPKAILLITRTDFGEFSLKIVIYPPPSKNNYPLESIYYV